MWEILGFLVGSVIFIVSLVAGLVTLILQGIPLYKMALRRSINNAWLSFIPLGNTWIMLNLPTNEFNLLGIKAQRSKALWKVVLIMILMYIPVVVFAGTELGFISTVFSFIFSIFSLAFSYRLIKDVLDTYSTGSTIAWAIASIFIPFVQIIVLYMLMNREPINRCNNTGF